jgi:hypothetical protein
MKHLSSPFLVETPKKFFQGYEFRDDGSALKKHLVLRLEGSDPLCDIFQILSEKMSEDHLKKWTENGCRVAFSYIGWYLLNSAWLCKEVYRDNYLENNKIVVISLDGDKFNAHQVLKPPFLLDQEILNLIENYDSFIIPILGKAKNQTTEIEKDLFNDCF